ncbi:HNH endonuclease signature motif containing protein [Aspergillus neoniger CBS 115656]|uniref:HNH nuclease domain-containing protein n=1 Tax=Aspergillus neoniger (strain CBS 115656) TaxID=1448310 RepID=A0A318Y4T5_ASPNB|nr:hypothetical protein BO87DRAFT_430671 [Aspergillus neoniger CBS 115656]PYH29255.1 hypothetical protein BO87DRAFT_430671 [Aspergillus neoniger CBS 115656]
MSSFSGPSMGFNDPERLKLLTGILESIRSYELASDIPQGTLQISTPIWFGMWLADISELQWYSREFDRDVMSTLLRHNGGSFARILTMYLPGSGIGGKFAASQPGTGAVTPVRSMESSLANSPTASRIAPITTPTESSPTQPVAKKRKYEAMEPPSSPSISSKIKKEINRKDLSEAVQCLDRDRVCIISKATDPLHAAHIIPASVCDTTTPTKKLKFLEFKALLRMFWSQETIQRWLEGKESILMSVGNLVALSPNCHTYWDRALFGLMPFRVSEDHKSMELHFYWLCGKGLPATGNSLLLINDSEGNSTISPIMMPETSQKGGRAHHVDVATPNLKLYNNDSDTVIYSGDTIIITTSDPQKLQLPDEGLFALQWTLHRLAAMCAGAGWQPADGDDDEDDDNDLCLDNSVEITTPISERVSKSHLREVKKSYFQKAMADALSSWNVDHGY